MPEPFQKGNSREYVENYERIFGEEEINYRYCSRCGELAEHNLLFCNACGEKLEVEGEG